jgi:subtilisin family serine protease
MSMLLLLLLLLPLVLTCAVSLCCCAQVLHPDLAANIWQNPGETAGDRIDNDGNGRVDDVYGWDFFNNDASVYDAGGDKHGTHVSGTIGELAGLLFKCISNEAGWLAVQVRFVTSCTHQTG